VYIVINAFKNLFRNRERNGMIALVLIGVFLISVVAIMVYTVSSDVLDLYKIRFGTRVTLFPDLESAQARNMRMAEAYLPLESERQKAFSQSELLQRTEFQTVFKLMPCNLKVLSDGKAEAPQLTVVGLSEESLARQFQSGRRTIVLGGMFRNPDECVISTALARLNQLQVGDTLTVEDGTTPYTLTIAGLYRDVTAGSSAFTGRDNEIFIHMDTIDNMPFGDEHGYTDAAYYLKSLELLPDFRIELADKGLPDYYKVVPDEGEYWSVAAPVMAMRKIAAIFISVGLTIGAVLFVFLLSVSLRERGHEINVLRTVGMKKSRIAIGFILEILMLTVFCLCIGTLCGRMLAGPVTGRMLERQIEVSEKKQEDLEKIDDTKGLSAKPDIEDFEVAITLEAVFWMGTVTLVPVLLSGGAVVLYMLRHELSDIF